MLQECWLLREPRRVIYSLVRSEKRDLEFYYPIFSFDTKETLKILNLVVTRVWSIGNAINCGIITVFHDVLRLLFCSFCVKST